jgi:hypothetical protein
MNEVEKMYENAEPNRNCNLYKHFTECPMKHTQCEDCENFVYPPFTAEKQLELYKYLCKPFLITTRYYFDEFSITAENTFEWKTVTKVSATSKTYEECIAKLVNNLWQDLTDVEKAEIKNILE